MVRWGQWQNNPKIRGWNLQWQEKNFPKGTGKLVGIYPPELADGNFQLPPWMA
jgi:hypothetical protein